MVTHDPRFARHADRTIHLFDGQVVDESDYDSDEWLISAEHFRYDLAGYETWFKDGDNDQTTMTVDFAGHVLTSATTNAGYPSDLKG